MRRRKFIALLGGASAWPLAVRAQQPAMPVIGFLRSTPEKPFAHIVAAFRQGLQETGFVESQNIVIEQRWDLVDGFVPVHVSCARASLCITDE